MPTILKISDGTTTVDFVASTSAYAVTRWNPAVARRRDNLLGGRGPYEDVYEEMEITIHGTDALAQLSSLQDLLDQSTRWARGEPVSAVLLHYQPESTSTELKSTILGAADREMIELPGNFPDAPAYDYIEPIVLRFKRMGWWLGESVTGTSSSVQHPTVATISLTTSVSIESPVKLKLSDGALNDAGIDESFILMVSAATTTAAATRLLLLEAETLTTTAYTTALDAVSEARGNAVLRYTPTTTAFVESGRKTYTTETDQGIKRWGVYLSYRNNSTTSGYQVRGLINVNEKTPTLVIPEGTSLPTWAYMGSVVSDRPLLLASLEVAATATGGTIDFDVLAFMAMDGTATPNAIVPVPKSYGGSVADYDGTIDHRLLSHNSPSLWIDAGLGEAQGWRGDATFVMRGAAVAAVWLATDSTAWVQNKAGTPISSTFIATRLEGHLTPE